MADALGVDQQGVGQSDLTTDYLGAKVPVSFRGQPALPSTAGAAAGGSTTPTIGGAGKAPVSPLQPLKSGERGETTFFDLASAMGSQGSGGPGPGEGSPTGQNTDVAGGPANIGLSVGFGPGQISIGPTGTISVGARGDSPMTQGLAQALNAAMSFAGVPTSVNLPSLAAALSAAPALAMAAQMANAAGAPLTLASLAHMFASMSPTSVTSLQAALADPNPEAQLSLAQAIAIANGGAKGPTQGGPQAIGALQGFDNPVTNVNAATQAGPTAPAANFSEAGQLSPTFADLAAALGFGTNRGVDPDAPTADPNADAAAAAATASATAGTGVSSSTGSEGASASGPSDGGGPGSGAPGDGPY